jgi:hypothetical protein
MGFKVSVKDALRILYNLLLRPSGCCVKKKRPSGCEANVVVVTHEPLDMDIWWCAGIASSVSQVSTEKPISWSGWSHRVK